ncbi:MAG TPA: hypothetical protein VKG22_01100, partial [Stellaceae bacterium]|nr:hypothetical protein [Stellaceae bacterium]
EEAMGSSVPDRRKLGPNAKQPELTRRELLALTALGMVAGAPGLVHAAPPQGQLTWAIHVSLAPTWFDPAETAHHAIHDPLRAS